MSDLPGRPSRRAFLKATAATATVAGFTGTAKAKVPPPPLPLDKYVPEYLNPEEWEFIMAATARIIPEEGRGPSAHEARVPVFIDRQLAGDFGKASDWYMAGPHDASASALLGYQTPLAPADVYREGIPLFNAWCREKLGRRFADLTPDQQDAALSTLEGKGQEKVQMTPETKGLFALLLQNTREGYFADPIYGGNYRMAAWVHIGFPGARAAYTEWISRYDVKYPLGPVSISGERA